jgi:hypothetical protein
VCEAVTNTVMNVFLFRAPAGPLIGPFPGGERAPPIGGKDFAVRDCYCPGPSRAQKNIAAQTGVRRILKTFRGLAPVVTCQPYRPQLSQRSSRRGASGAGAVLGIG